MNIIKSMKYLVVVLLFCYLNNIRCEEDKCNFGTCGECISFAHDTCVWCAQDDLHDRRCRSYSSLKANTSWCKKEFMYNPQPSKQVIEDKDFGEMKKDFTIQFKPQLMKIKARPGIPIKFDMSFKPAKDFPLDVYYLMDTSFTMQQRMSDLKTQANLIYKDLTSYTNNVRLGIGSFVEKPEFPFVDPNLHKSHAFANRVPLTDDMRKFTSMIDQITFGSNFDDPEAGLDALMQAMKCDKEIGWRKGARRIIVLCTDSTYHSAGDGKIVGAIKPNDMTCHLDNNNTYNMAMIYDYPSISQINWVATDENIKLIFAIATNELSHVLHDAEYKALTMQIEGARYAELTNKNSVLKIIKESYEEMANSMPIKFEAPDFVEVTIDQDCTSVTKRNCESPHKKIVNITGTLTIKSCPTDGKPVHIVKVNPYGLPDKLIIELDIDCKCSCEQEKGIPSSKCHGAGVIQCGVCKCDPGSYGVDCRCNGTSTDQKDMEKCRLHADSKLCNGKGKCRCGKCEDCKKGFSGDFCEFDDNSCPRPNNQLCSDKGKCRRGQCECDAHWTGNDCSCPDHNLDCIAPYSEEVCSGRGECKCGVCKCYALKGKNETYSGAFCDNCEECAAQRCIQLENYAYCNYMHMDNKSYCDEKRNGTATRIGVSFVNKTEFNGPKLYMATWCKKDLDSNNGTYIVFKYHYENHELKLTIQKEVEVPPEVDVWLAVGSAIGLVLLIGILTIIIWKILVDIHDKREYNKFENEAKAAGFLVDNPLYQGPTNNFENPVFNPQC